MVWIAQRPAKATERQDGGKNEREGERGSPSWASAWSQEGRPEAGPGQAWPAGDLVAGWQRDGSRWENKKGHHSHGGLLAWRNDCRSLRCYCERMRWVLMATISPARRISVGAYWPAQYDQEDRSWLYSMRPENAWRDATINAQARSCLFRQAISRHALSNAKVCLRILFRSIR